MEESSEAESRCPAHHGGPAQYALQRLSGRGGEVFIWPSAANLSYDKLTKKEIADLQRLYKGQLEDQYIEGHGIVYYAGWRLSINSDGTWSEFVAGD